jgi:DNA primase
MIPDEVIAEVLDRADVLAVVGRVVQLRKAGTVYKGLCPFHDERSPSFTVSPQRRTYHCFGCQAHGHAIDFMMKAQGHSFPEAVRALAAEVGVTVPDDKPVSAKERAERDAKKSLADRLHQVQDALAAYFTDTLFDARRGARARAYLDQRGITRRAAEAFRLGWADGDKARFEKWRAEKNIDLADLVTLGIVIPPEQPAEGPLAGGYLRFRERVIFPVMDLRGEVVGFGGRILTDDKKIAKYINSPETPIYTKGEQVYGAHTASRAARREGRVVLCEGNVDVIMLWQAGFEGTVAAMGTALTPKQVRLVKRLGEKVVCVMDGDGAGRKAAFASLVPFLEAGIHPRAVMLPDGEDPDSFVRARGPDAFRALLDAAPPLLDVLVAHEAAAHPADPPGRAAALRAIAPALLLVGDPIEKGLYQAKIAETLGIPLALVEAARGEPAPSSEPRRARKEPAPRQAAPEPPPAMPEPPADAPPPPFEPSPFEVFEAPAAEKALEPGPPPPDRRRFDAMPRYEKDVVDILLHFPEQVVRFAEAGGLEALTDSGVAAFFSGLCEEVRSGRTPNEERSIADLEDRSLAAFLTSRLAKKPDQTEETVIGALDQASATLLTAHRKRQADEERRRQAGGATGRPRATLAALKKRPPAASAQPKVEGGLVRAPSSKNQGAH